MFGRDGKWHTDIFKQKIKEIEIWEIDKKWKLSLEKNFPNSKIRIQDSIKTLSEKNDFEKFDLILIDNPMNIFSSYNKENSISYCEHFDIIKNVYKLIDKKAVVVFNINRKPFDYEKYPKWAFRRNNFYNVKDASDLKLEFLKEFYKNYFLELGFITIFNEDAVRVTQNNEDMTFYFAYYLERK